jgi:hypothetical protein
MPGSSGDTSIVPIQFAPNGTYVDIIELFRPEKKNILCKCHAGQVMSFRFIRTMGRMDIYHHADRGRRLSLCEAIASFGGDLPTTQYLVTVTPSVDASIL